MFMHLTWLFEYLNEKYQCLAMRSIHFYYSHLTMTKSDKSIHLNIATPQNISIRYAPAKPLSRSPEYLTVPSHEYLISLRPWISLFATPLNISNRYAPSHHNLPSPNYLHISIILQMLAGHLTVSYILQRKANNVT